MNIQKIEADVGIIVGRFQVHELHPGHLELLNWVQDNYPTMMIVLGCSNMPQSIRNPLGWQARAAMIHEKFPSAVITHVSDCRDDAAWSASLDTTIRTHLRPNQKPVLIGSRDSFISYYSGAFPTMEVVGEAEKVWSGTKVRKLLANRVISSPDFRAGVIHQALGYYPMVIPTVDIAVFENDAYRNVYLVRKHGEDKLRFPGGFCEPGNSYEIEAIREAREEIGDLEISHPEYMGNFPIDDWRFRNEPHQIRTTFFRAHKLFGPIGPKDKDEIADVELLDKHKIKEHFVVPEHHILLSVLLGHNQGELA